MKRSRNVSLVFMGLGAIGLTGCGESNSDIYVYNNPQQCVSDKRGTASECESAFTRARAEHKLKAPNYEDKADCERDFGAGKCEDTATGGTSESTTSTNSSTRRSGGSWVPFMVGYMMGSNASSPVAPQPLYQFQGQNNYRTPGGGVIPANVGGTTTGARTVPSSSIVPANRATTVARGGFGTTALAVSHSSAT